MNSCVTRRADATAKLIERLLASPQYGERWGRHWMDLVRYADTAGENSDYPIPQAYRYRNYIIDSFNADKPYDQFVREQIAGDLMPAERRPTTQRANHRDRLHRHLQAIRIGDQELPAASDDRRHD